jgi:hypothetical protein
LWSDLQAEANRGLGILCKGNRGEKEISNDEQPGHITFHAGPLSSHAKEKKDKRGQNISTALVLIFSDY